MTIFTRFAHAFAFALVIYIYMGDAIEAETPSLATTYSFTCSKAKVVKAPNDLIERVQSSYKKLELLSASFLQRSSLVGFTKQMESLGQLTFRPPGGMYWKYSSPREQLFISDGSRVWFYEPDLKQVTLGSLDGVFDSSIPVSFLLGIGALDESFKLESACKAEEGHWVLSLSPKESDPALKSLVLLVNSQSFLPVGAKLTDFGDSATEFHFSQIKTDGKSPDNLFNFEIPEGVDVITR